MAKCTNCGKSMTWELVQRYCTGIDGGKHFICKKCFSSFLHPERMIYDSSMGKIIELKAEEAEIHKKCNSCGHIFSFNNQDLKRNRDKAKSAIWSSLGGIAGAMSGAHTASAVNTGNANSVLDGIVDYNKCPHCGSRDLVILSSEEMKNEREKKKQNSQAPAISTADEIKKYKELLDCGIITQEEFNEKKKQLLGL